MARDLVVLGEVPVEMIHIYARKGIRIARKGYLFSVVPNVCA